MAGMTAEQFNELMRGLASGISEGIKQGFNGRSGFGNGGENIPVDQKVYRQLDEKDFRRIIKMPEFQYMVCTDNEENEIPFAINAKQIYNEESGGVCLTFIYYLL